MRRTALLALKKWKNSPNRKPLIIRGARQVGKTWLMKNFGKAAYKNIVYVNFENDYQLKNLFQQNFDIERILSALQLFSGIKPEPQDTLIIFDEIQEAERAITSLKYFYENAPEYHIVAAGSLLGVALHEGTSFPVGKIDFLDLYPLSFIEFMLALGENGLVESLQKQDWQLITVFKDKYINLLKQYYYIGGMPEVVVNFAADKDFRNARRIQRQILDSYEQDLSKHVPANIVPRIRMVWNSIPAQLAKENRKFIYGLIKEGARAKDFELALAWLVDCGLIHQLYRVKKPNMPLKAYEDFGAFKLYLFDVGLLAAMAELDAKILLNDSSIFTEFKGALTEQFVLQQFVIEKELNCYYWSAEKSEAEIDVLIQYKNMIIPVEVKASENLQSKSLRSFKDKYSPVLSVRTSMSDFREEEWLTNLPLYAINEFQKYCDLKTANNI